MSDKLVSETGGLTRDSRWTIIVMISKLLPSIAIVAFAAQIAPAAGPEDEIRAVLTRQSADWNRGSTDAFVEGYSNEAVFVSDTVTRGAEGLRERYRKRYPTPAAMGHLTFSDLEVKMLGAEHAYVIGRWKLERSKEGGGDTGGIFTLVVRKTALGWKIILDHPS